MVDEQVLQALMALDGAPGDERRVSAYLREQLAPYADDFVYDNLGSIYAIKRAKTPNAPRVMVSGHMDEVGFVAKRFNDNGTIAGLALGEPLKASLLGSAVRFTLANGQTVMGTLLAHDTAGNAMTAKQDVLIDCGFASAKQAQQSGLQIGDRAVFAEALVHNAGSQRVIAKAFNGRYAPLMGIALLKAVAGEALPFDLYVGCTVQETVGLRGVQTATNAVQPDLGIVVDTDAAFDTQKDAQDRIGRLGDGVLLNFFDQTVLPNRLLLQTLKQVCEAQGLPYQYYYSLAGSDAAWINKLRTGTPTLFVNVAVRNMDTPQQVADLGDLQSAQQALIAFIQQLTPEQIAAFKAENR
ncbi:M42 family metallopeptidase [Lacticaseibacillus baoqingensis]|uniref:M42 family metallopeptidase n=1 Tax=Lacticaseibacillus baoqingensis TaxID=2486013 RepID=A0ABW4E9Y7_9LACO|nr:M42 family peptidase [Lacticaseibacillus baoqingensis]